MGSGIVSPYTCFCNPSVCSMGDVHAGISAIRFSILLTCSDTSPAFIADISYRQTSVLYHVVILHFVVILPCADVIKTVDARLSK